MEMITPKVLSAYEYLVMARVFNRFWELPDPVLKSRMLYEGMGEHDFDDPPSCGWVGLHTDEPWTPFLAEQLRNGTSCTLGVLMANGVHFG